MLSLPTSKAGRSILPSTEQDAEDEEEEQEEDFKDEPWQSQSIPSRKLGAAAATLLLVLTMIGFFLFYAFVVTSTKNDEQSDTLEITVNFWVQDGELDSTTTVLEDVDSCDELIISRPLSRPTDATCRPAGIRFLLVRRIRNHGLEDNVARLEAILNKEDLDKYDGKIQRHWIVDNLLPTKPSDNDSLESILDARGEAYTRTASSSLVDFWQAPLVFSNFDTLHQTQSYASIANRTLTDDVFRTVYQHKLKAWKQPANQSTLLQQIWSSSITTDYPCTFLVQWGGFCRVPSNLLEHLEQWATSQSGRYEVSLPTTPLPPSGTTEMNQNFLLQVEKLALEHIGKYNWQNLTFYNLDTLQREKQIYMEENLDSTNNRTSLVGLIDYLISLADISVSFGPWSVMDKPNCDLLPSCHYYYSRSPYYWPAPDTPEGYEKRDGYRVPGSSTHDSESYKYDRTRWYDVYTNTTILALAWFFSNNDTYAEVGARNIRTWFLDPSTRMEPTLLYAHVKQWKDLPDDYSGNAYGHIDLVDVYFFMDTIRLIFKSGHLLDDEQQEMNDWFRQLLDYLLTTRSGIRGYVAGNNIGTYHDLFVMAVASFVGDIDTLVTTVPWTTERLWEQVDPTSGALPHELARPTCMHYQIYCLEGWTNVARVAQGIGYNLWPTKRDGTEPLCQAVEYVLARGGACPGNIAEEDPRKLWPLWFEAMPHCPGITDPTNATISSPYDVPNDVVSHYWNLGMQDQKL